MALIQIKDYTHLISQESIYVYLRDEDQSNVSTINWTGLAPAGRTNIVDCMVWMDRAVPGIYNIHFRDEVKKYMSTIGVDYDIWMYGISRYIVGNSYVIGNIVWLNEEVWSCLVNTSTTPSLTNVNWVQIIETNTDLLLGYDVDLSNMYVFRPVNSPALGNISVTKTDDHKFTVKWLGQGTISHYALRDYNGKLIEEDDMSGVEIDFIITQDGVYYVEMQMDDRSFQYAEIYDFTDTEKCYLVLMKSVLCDCVDCKDCPDKNYMRALNYANTYLTLRDIVYADQSQLIGLVSTDTLRTEYLAAIGLLVEKLRVLSDECACSN